MDQREITIEEFGPNKDITLDCIVEYEIDEGEEMEWPTFSNPLGYAGSPSRLMVNSVTLLKAQINDEMMTLPTRQFQLLCVLWNLLEKAAFDYVVEREDYYFELFTEED